MGIEQVVEMWEYCLHEIIDFNALRTYNVYEVPCSLVFHELHRLIDHCFENFCISCKHAYTCFFVFVACLIYLVLLEPKSTFSFDKGTL